MPELVPIRRLGAGFFGEVWLVQDRALGRQVAVKYVRPNRIHDPSNFYHEPHALVDLEHRNIVEVFDAGTMPDGRLYVLMEYLPHGSVEDRYQGSVVSIDEAVGLIVDACYGVEHAHSLGYVHRDIKPANLLLSNKGRVKVSDFGLATKTDKGGIASPVGYVAHLPPEVIAGGPSSPLADVYALGVTAYRLINGDAYLPDQASLSKSLEEAIMAGEYPRRSYHRAYVPRSLRRVLTKAMAPDPAKRFQSAAELRHALEKALPAVSWREVPTTAVAAWEGRSETHDWRADIVPDGPQYVFTVTRRPKVGTADRRLRNDCGVFTSSGKALAHAERVLQRVCTMGG